MSHTATLSPESPLLILLATYNGAAHVAEQISSIVQQEFRGWRLLVRDDGSTDATTHIVREFAARDARIELLTDSGQRWGVVGNFAALAEAALARQSRYIAFADQDDVWHPQKLASTLNAVRAAEEKAPPGTPIAAHTELEVVDGSLKLVHPSFLRFQGLWHEAEQPLRTLLVQNFVTGCTLVANQALLKLALPVPAEALVHDWWFALCAAAAGRLEFVPRATVQYRQHGGNTIGAHRWWSPRFWPKLRQLTNRGKSLAIAVRQSRALHRRLRERSCCSWETNALLEGYCRLEHETSSFKRVRSLRRLGTRRQGRLRNAILFAQASVLRPCEMD